MTAFLESLSVLQQIFLLCAVIGSTVFLFRVLMMLISGFGDTDMDTAHDADAGIDSDMDADAHLEGFGHADADASFHLLSIQGVTGFFMMFGLVGLAMSKQSAFGDTVSVAGATGAGVLMMFIIAKVVSALKRLQSSGTIDMRNAIGQQGSVYLTIPAGGQGKVQVVVQEHLKIFEAVAENKQEIKTGQNVDVVSIVSNSILVVKQL